MAFQGFCQASLGKTCYGERHEAQKAAQFLATRKGKNRMRPYLCKDCRNWHLASVRG